jgi:hypothetical protein
MSPKHLLLVVALLISLVGFMPGSLQAAAPATAPAGAWLAVNNPAPSTPYGVDMVSTNDGWIVGENGTIMRWNGASWTIVPSPVSNVTLFSVSMVTAQYGWAVGDGGTILHWDGASWSQVTSPTTITLLSVHAPSTLTAWATGYDEIVPAAPGKPGSISGVVLLWDSAVGHWSVFRTDQITHNFITTSGPYDAWTNGSGTSLMHWSNSTWSTYATPTGVLGADFYSATDGWAVGNGPTLHWNGTTWTVSNSAPTHTLYSVSAMSANDVWAVGGWFYGAYITHWDGTSWTDVPTSSQTILFSVDMLSSSDGWAVSGWRSDGSVLRYRPGLSYSPLMLGGAVTR